MFSCLFYPSPVLSIIKYTVFKEKKMPVTPSESDDYGIILKIKVIITQA